MRKAQPLLVLALLLAQSIALSAHAGDWPHFRGPAHNGWTIEKNLPEDLSDPKVRAWTTPLPGISSATPVISGDRVFVVSTDSEMETIFALCLDTVTGKVLWQKTLAEVTMKPGRNTPGSSSAVTDGEMVYFIAEGKLFAMDMDGNPLWTKDFSQEYSSIDQQFGYSSSPLLFEGKLYLSTLNGQWSITRDRTTYTDKDSYLTCLDPKTGEVVWRAHRPSDANGESFDSYASPMPYAHGDVRAIITQGGDYLTTHDAATGKELWRQHHNPKQEENWRLIPSPVAAGEWVVGVQPRGGDVFGIEHSKAEGRIAYDDSHWIYGGQNSDVPCPLYADGKLYYVNGVRRYVVCLDPATGAEIWKGDLGGKARFWSSPTGGDGKVYCLNEKGEVSVFSIKDGFKLLSHAKIGEGVCKSSVAVANGRLFVRTAEALHCLTSP